MTVSPTDLFTARAPRYAAHRPDYPAGVFRELTRRVAPGAVVADIGAGTGLFSRGLRSAGYDVIAVEPNAAMRSEAAATGGDPPLFVMDGRAEATGLPGGSVDLITVAQAFHWLDRPAAKAEFGRIGRGAAPVAVLWNSRRFGATAFMRDYRRLLLDFAPRYSAMKREFWGELDRDVRTFFSDNADHFTTPHRQRAGLDAMIGGLLSLSYVPADGEAGHAQFVDAARRVFDRHEEDGSVWFEYQTVMYVGPLT